MRQKHLTRRLLPVFFAMAFPHVAAAQFVTGLQGGSGSAVGPGGALYVTEGLAGRVSRVDPTTGEVTTFATGLPPSLIGIGGAMDVAFIGSNAYVLVTLVGQDLIDLGVPGVAATVGIYRVDGPDSFTEIADIGQWSIDNPPGIEFDFFVPTGVQYALEPYRGGFLVTDGHLNRVLHVTRDGEISEFRAFGNVVPTGLAVRGDTLYMAQAGPIPHHPEDGKVVSFTPRSSDVTEVASGGRLLVDVKFGRGQTLYALSQGIWEGEADGEPANPLTGSLLRVNANGGFNVLVTALDIPTSFQFIGDTAYVVTLPGEIWKLDNVVSDPPFGRPR